MDTVRRGDTGEGVWELQQGLKVLGIFQGGVNGKFGKKTEAAVMLFQRADGLVADGVVGPKTWGRLLEKTAAPVKPAGRAVYRYLGSNGGNGDRQTVIEDETALWCARMCVGEDTAARQRDVGPLPVVRADVRGRGGQAVHGEQGG